MDTVLLTASEIREKLPLIADNAKVHGAMFTASDGRAEPSRTTRAMFEAAIEAGVSVILGERVTRVDIQAGHVHGVWIGRKLYRSDQVRALRAPKAQSCCARLGTISRKKEYAQPWHERSRPQISPSIHAFLCH